MRQGMFRGISVYVCSVIMCLALTCSMVLLCFIATSTVAFAQTSQKDLEKQRLKDDIKRLQDRQFNSSGAESKAQTQFNDGIIDSKKRQLKDLDKNSEQYFYNKAEKDRRIRDDAIRQGQDAERYRNQQGQSSGGYQGRRY